MSPRQQNYANHPRFPALIALIGLAALVVTCLRGYQLVRAPSLDSLAAFLLPAALLAMCFGLRIGDLTLQDRVIRAEMHERLKRLLGEERRADIERLSLKSLIALRFASDEQLPELVELVLSGALVQPDAIKRRVQQWRGDELRV
jgi:hypothetical protein